MRTVRVSILGALLLAILAAIDCRILLPSNDGTTFVATTSQSNVTGTENETQGEVSNTRTRRHTVNMKAALWPSGVVNYEFDPKFDRFVKQVVEIVMREIESVSCVRFSDRSRQTKKAEHYVYITGKKGDGCRASVGYTWSPAQVYNMDYKNSCYSRRTILHELMHTLGFYHEHTRVDRDKYVQINWDNVAGGRNADGFQYIYGKINTAMPYDFDSIMHYNSHAGAINPRKPSIEAKYPYQHKQQTMGRGTSLSALDIKKLNILYGC